MSLVVVTFPKFTLYVKPLPRLWSLTTPNTTMPPLLWNCVNCLLHTTVPCWSLIPAVWNPRSSVVKVHVHAVKNLTVNRITTTDICASWHHLCSLGYVYNLLVCFWLRDKCSIWICHLYNYDGAILHDQMVDRSLHIHTHFASNHTSHTHSHIHLGHMYLFTSFWCCTSFLAHL